MKNYLIKRNPDFVDKGVIVKRKVKNKGFSETTIRNKAPQSNKLKIGDMIYVAETKYGIYAKGLVSEVCDIEYFDTIEKAVEFFSDGKIKGASYWMSKIGGFQKQKLKDENAVLKFQEYKIDQQLLGKTVPLTGALIKLKKIQGGITLLMDDVVSHIEQPNFENENELKPEIPSHLKMDLHSLFSKNLKVTHWIDIDHFVPKSSGGPGNIIENLVPIGLGLNRYKGNSVPKGLFIIANKEDKLKEFCKDRYLTAKEEFLRRPKYANAFDSACKINDRIKKSFTIEEAKIFYRSVMNRHYPKYIEILDLFD
jgi:hypothetical protein|tara:strand:- start:1680 stop:2609 length:930 start_codon:yes stop_codon:yes gene_type:complete